jgi:hypothetical protein
MHNMGGVINSNVTPKLQEAPQSQVMWLAASLSARGTFKLLTARPRTLTPACLTARTQAIKQQSEGEDLLPEITES